MAAAAGRWTGSSPAITCTTIAASRIRPSSFNAIHDTTNQFHGLAYVSGIIDPNTRVSLILGGFDGSFQIPNNPGQPTLGLTVNGVSSFNSADLNETQHESHRFRRSFRLQKHVERHRCAGLVLHTRNSTLSFSPDWLGDLLFNGIAQQAVASGRRNRRAERWKLADQ